MGLAELGKLKQVYDAHTKEELEALARMQGQATGCTTAELARLQLQNAYPMTPAELQQAAVNMLAHQPHHATILTELNDPYDDACALGRFNRYTLRTPASTLLAWLKGTP